MPNKVPNVPITASWDAWLQGALAELDPVDLVFLDPDNGISPKEDSSSKLGHKHTFLNDIRVFHKEGKSIVVYHSLLRGVKGYTHRSQIRDWSKKLRNEFELQVRGLRYCRWVSRAFFVIMQKEHRELLESRLDNFGRGPWGQCGHFEIVV